MTSTAVTRRAESIYVAAACNRSDIADSSIQDGLVAFGSANLIALWNSASPEYRGIERTLAGHRGNISALRFAKTINHDRTSRYLVTGDNKGQVIVWKQGQDRFNWSIRANLKGHSLSISCVATLPLDQDDDSLLIFTGGSDACIHVWRLNHEAEPQLIQKIDMKGKIPLVLEASYLPASTSIALAVGSTDSKLTIYSSPSTTSSIKFSKSLSLSGHSDWIRSLSFLPSRPSDSTPKNYDLPSNEILLASGSQDHYIRLWRFSPAPSRTDSKTGLISTLEALDALDEKTSSADGELRLKSFQFSCITSSRTSTAGEEAEGEVEENFACSSEAVLLGHDSWITGLNWFPIINSAGDYELKLLSASADRSMILWKPTPLSFEKEEEGSIWTSQHRFGEFSSATNLGFFGALWGLNGRVVLANGWGGSWHVWERVDQEDEDEEKWEPRIATAGHFAEAKCVEWEPEGEWLMSCGHDMATRLHGPWRRKASSGKDVKTWHELARPQIHGYPLTSIAFLDRLNFASGADEKIVRLFTAPGNFIKSLRVLSNVELGNEDERPMAANVPPLGLSNRAIGSTVEEEEDDALSSQIVDSKDPFMAAAAPPSLSIPIIPPFEEHLLGSTLWPEVEKLYGHGFEILSIAVRKSDGLLATSCKATSEEHAVVRLFDSKKGVMVGRKEGLKGHGLSITRVRFGGEEGKWILSVSRDRSWRIFERCDGDELYQPLRAGVKAHARIIWDACFSSDSTAFFTASRDKTVKEWSTSSWSETANLKFEEAATSVACTRIDGIDVLAVGLENGEIHVFTREAGAWVLASQLKSDIAHVQTVTSLAFCPKAFRGRTARLASSSDDRSVRIIDISL